MDVSAEPRPKTGLSDYLAAERTLLAWIRTGLALMGFGFVVARFGLFLQQISATLLGVVVNVFAGLSHVRLVRELDRGETAHSLPSTQAVAVAFLLALLGLAMAIYLVSVRSSSRAQPQNREETSMNLNAGNGIIDKPSKHSVDETVANLRGILQAKGVTVFAVVDHSGEAEKVGMKMPPTKLLIFGNPKAGTPLMLAAPRSAIDLPLKILVWEDARGKVWVSHNSPAYLQERHGLPPELLPNIAVVESLATKAAE